MATITNTNLFVPTQISGCTLWLDAADPATVLTSGSSVTGWNDKSGNGNNSTGVTGTVSYSSNLITFSGNLTTSFISYPSLPFSLTNMTVFAVVRFTSSFTYPTDANFYFANFFESTGATPMMFGFTRFNTAPYSWILNNYTSGGATNGQGLINFSGAGGPSGLTYLFTIQNTNSTYTQFSAGSNINTNSVIRFTPTTPAAFSVGRGANGIQVGELIFFQNSALNAQDRQQIEGYLAWKWNLQRNLPTTHPFFNNPVLPNVAIPQLITPFTQTNVIQPVTSPLQVSGCALWLDAADSTSVVLSSSNVTQWNDKSGNGRNATGILAQSPTYDSVNRRITFNGTNQYLSNIGFSINLSQRSIFIVFQQFVYTIYAGVLPIIPNPISGTDHQTTTGMTIETQSGLLFYQNNNLYQNNILTTTPVPYGMYYEQMNGTAGTTFRNGNFNANVTSGFTSGSCGGYGIGCRWVSGAIQPPYLNGAMHEAIIFNSALTTAQRQQIEGYLAWKWGLQASLPTNHPYFFNPLVPNLVLQSQTLTMSRAVGFQPNQISGLSLWLDAADTSRMTLVGSNVTQYIDKSPNAIVLSNTTVANQPTLVLDTNNIPNILFNGSTQFLQNASVAASNLSLNNEVTVFFAHSPTNNDNSLICWTNAGGIPRINFHTPGGTGFIFDYAQSGTGGGRVEAVVANYLTSGRRMEGGYKRGTTQVIRAYGRDLASRTNNLTLTGSTSLLLTLGSFNGTGFYYGGRFCELVWFNRGLSDSEIGQVEGYLAWKWGLQTSLPSSHPFSLFPPG